MTREAMAYVGKRVVRPLPSAFNESGSRFGLEWDDLTPLAQKKMIELLEELTTGARS
jgi:hypothetical protein